MNRNRVKSIYYNKNNNNNEKIAYTKRKYKLNYFFCSYVDTHSASDVR